MSFDLLDKQVPSGTAWYTFHNLWLGAVDKEGTQLSPRLQVRYAGKGNPGYRSAVLKIGNEARGKPTPLKISEARIDEGVRSESELFAANVVVGWEHVHDDGKPAPFSQTKCVELLIKIGDKFPTAFAQFTEWCREHTNFPNTLETSGVELGKG